MREVGKPPRRSKAATLATLKRDLGKEKIGHLDRQNLIAYGKMRPSRSPTPCQAGQRLPQWQRPRSVIRSLARLHLVQAQRRAGKRQVIARCDLCDRGHILGNATLPCCHFGTEAFEAAGRQDDEMPCRNVADEAKAMFLAAGHENCLTRPARKALALQRELRVSGRPLMATAPCRVVTEASWQSGK